MPFESLVGAGFVVFIMVVFAASLALADWTSSGAPARRPDRH